jgi:hypothetical protein
LYWSLALNVEHCPTDKLYGPDFYRGRRAGYIAFGFGALQLWVSWERSDPRKAGHN